MIYLISLNTKMKEDNLFCTVFTPTYNREDTLKRLYDSLVRQTNKSFEWVIIDDGSIDNTEQVVNEFIKNENQFEIIYKKVQNGGKHRAINRGLDIARGKMFFIVDSDDYITDNAIEKIEKYEKTISNSNEKYAGVAGNKGFDEKTLVGTTFNTEFIDATSLERKKYNIYGDKTEIFYTELLKKNKFPEFDGEKFVTEALVWNRIARQGYKLRWFKDIIYICEYRDDGLTKKGTSRFKDSPKGLKTYILEYVKDYKLSFPKKCLQYEHYSNSIYDNKNIIQASKDLNVKPIYIKIGVFLRKIVNLVRRKR